MSLGAKPAAIACATPYEPASGVIFDAPDVLYDATLWRCRLLRIVHRLGIAADYDQFFAAWDRDYQPDVNCGWREPAEAFQSFLLAAGLTWAQVDEVEAASRIQAQKLDELVRPLPGVVTTVAKLSERQIPLAVWADVSCGSARMTERLERLSLGCYFRQVLTSFDLECAQPSPACYESAVDSLGIAAGEMLYVGHDARHLAGSCAAGLRTAAFNYQADSIADYYLIGFETLLESSNCPSRRRGAAHRNWRVRDRSSPPRAVEPQIVSRSRRTAGRFDRLLGEPPRQHVPLLVCQRCCPVRANRAIYRVARLFRAEILRTPIGRVPPNLERAFADTNGRCTRYRLPCAVAGRRARGTAACVATGDYWACWWPSDCRAVAVCARFRSTICAGTQRRGCPNCDLGGTSRFDICPDGRSSRRHGDRTDARERVDPVGHAREPR